jgi:hypothetical protein
MIVSAAAVSLILLVFFTQTLTGWLRNVVPAFNNYDPFVADQSDWWSLRTMLEEKGFLDSKHFVVASRYDFCFKAQLVLKDALPIACLSDNPISLSLWRNDAALAGRDAFIVTNWWRPPPSIEAIEAKFERVEQIEPIQILHHGHPTMRVFLLLGHNLRGPLFEPAKAAP